MMKKFLLLTTAIIAISASQAIASDIELKPYVGFDISYAKMKFRDQRIVNSTLTDYRVNNDKIIFAGIAGVRINKNIGVQLYTDFSNKSDNDRWFEENESYHYSIGGDILGFVPLNFLPDAVDMEAFAGIGAGYYDFKIRERRFSFGNFYRYNYDEDGLGIRYTLGLQYNITKNFGVTAFYRYIDLDSFKINNLNEFGTGFRYTF